MNVANGNDGKGFFERLNTPGAGLHRELRLFGDSQSDQIAKGVFKGIALVIVGLAVLGVIAALAK